MKLKLKYMLYASVLASILGGSAYSVHNNLTATDIIDGATSAFHTVTNVADGVGTVASKAATVGSNAVDTATSVADTVTGKANDITSENASDGTVVQSDISIKTPSIELAKSVLTPSVMAQLGNETLEYKDGSFIIGDGETDLDASVSSKPYVNLTTKQVADQTVPTTANALLKKSSRQYESRSKTGNGSTSWTPAGWHQIDLTELYGKQSVYEFAVNRGHLVAYAIAGSIKGFDASTSNQANIAVQTSWSNQANDDDSRGQNYYEGIVRKALDKNKTIRYRVTPIYNTESDLIPSGSRIEARSSDDSINFDVFVPNVQSGLSINYTTGDVTVW